MRVQTSEICRLRSQGKTWLQIGKQLGISATAARSRYQRSGRGRMVSSANTPDVDIDHKSPGPLTLEQLLKLYHLKSSEWEVVSLKVNRWEVGAKVDGVLLAHPLYQTKATLRPAKRQESDLARQLLKDFSVRPRVGLRDRERIRNYLSDGSAESLEVCPFDIHLAKLSWAPETGSNYDLSIAADAVKDLFGQLVRAAARRDFREVILPLGNDYYHYDNLIGTTTALTPQDRDSRFHKMFRVGHALAVHMIEVASQLADRVIVPIVPGNHDQQTMFTLGEVLAAEYKFNRKVKIDNGPALRKYVLTGKNLIGYTHGKWEKPHQLVGLMAKEAKAQWAASTCQEWHIGHLHHERRLDLAVSGEDMGVRIRHLPAICATDNFHATRGYIGSRSEMQAFVWRMSGGLSQQLFLQPDPKLYQ